jgi:excisionase family DNA binding protein
MTDRRFLTIKEVAERYGVLPRTVHGWVRSKRLRAYRIRRILRVDTRDLDAFDVENATR